VDQQDQGEEKADPEEDHAEGKEGVKGHGHTL
jgi:hypothetical protein